MPTPTLSAPAALDLTVHPPPPSLTQPHPQESAQ